jgi:hypothetical protein
LSSANAGFGCLEEGTHGVSRRIGIFTRTTDFALFGWRTQSSRRNGRGEKGVECFAESRHIDAVLRALGSGDAGDDAGEIELEEIGVIALALVGDAEKALGLVVVFHGGAKLFAATGAAEVVDRLGIDGEEAHRRAVFGSHVRDRGAVGQGEGGGAGSEELDELADDAVLPQDLGDAQGEVGGGDAFFQLTVEVDADDLGTRKVTGCPSMPASASIPPTPQPTTPRPLIMVVCESVPTRVSG